MTSPAGSSAAWNERIVRAGTHFSDRDYAQGIVPGVLRRRHAQPADVWSAGWLYPWRKRACARRRPHRLQLIRQQQPDLDGILRRHRQYYVSCSDQQHQQHRHAEPHAECAADAGGWESGNPTAGRSGASGGAHVPRDAPYPRAVLSQPEDAPHPGSIEHQRIYIALA